VNKFSYRKEAMILKRAKYVLWIFTEFFISLAHLIVAISVLLITRCIFLSPARRQRVYKKVKRYVFHLGYSMFGLWFFAPFVVVECKPADVETPTDSLIISNHVSDMDWMYISYMADRHGYLEDLTITMKESLGKYPVLGYLLRVFGSVFLSRGSHENGKRSHDTEKLAQACREAIDKGKRINILLFPEGTYTSNETLERSIRYYEKIKDNQPSGSNIFMPKYVLLPHTAGFQKLLLSMPESLITMRNITLFTTPYEPSVYENYKYKEVALGDKSFHLNLLIEIIKIPQDICDLMREIRATKMNKDTEKYTYLIQTFNLRTSSFLNGLFAKKQDMIEEYSKKSKLNGDSEFLEFCKENCGTEGMQFKVETHRISSPFKFFYMGLPLLICLLFIGLHIYYLIHRRLNALAPESDTPVGSSDLLGIEI